MSSGLILNRCDLFAFAQHLLQVIFDGDARLLGVGQDSRFNFSRNIQAHAVSLASRTASVTVSVTGISG